MLRITEFLASNDDGLLDADGDASDWLEIYNPGSEAVDLTGLHLTDSASNLSKWTFPSGFSLDPGGYRVVFASDKNGVLAGSELHTNFKLSADGEYLALVGADGTTIIDQFAPNFPAQVEDVSYGLAMSPTGASTTLIAEGAQVRAWVPTSSAVDTTWKSVGFNDNFFNIVGPTGLGFELSPGDAINYTADIATAVPSSTRSLYVRIPFFLSIAGRHRRADAEDEIRRRLRRLSQRRRNRRSQRPRSRRSGIRRRLPVTPIRRPKCSRTSPRAPAFLPCASGKTSSPSTP